jgi:hypothetical protein
MKLGHRVVLIALAAGFSAACTTPVIDLPPIVQRPNAEHHDGKIIWVDLVTPDLGQAKRFYGELFNWTYYSSPGDGRYVTAYLRDHPVGGMVEKPLPVGAEKSAAWLTYLSAPNVEAANEDALAHGAKDLLAPRTYANRGRRAVLADPQGAVVALLKSNGGDPPDSLVEPDRWIWSTLITRDVAAAGAFYRAVFGYQLDQLPADDGLRQIILEKDGYARASVNEIAGGGNPLHPRWLNFVRVEDAAASVAKAVSLGALVLVTPHVDRHGGRLAVLADPAGAVFGVMEWPDGTFPRAAK